MWSFVFHQKSFLLENRSKVSHLRIRKRDSLFSFRYRIKGFSIFIVTNFGHFSVVSKGKTLICTKLFLFFGNRLNRMLSFVFHRIILVENFLKVSHVRIPKRDSLFSFPYRIKHFCIFILTNFGHFSVTSNEKPWLVQNWFEFLETDNQVQVQGYGRTSFFLCNYQLVQGTRWYNEIEQKSVIIAI